MEPLCIHVCQKHQQKQGKYRAESPQTEPTSSESKVVLLDNQQLKSLIQYQVRWFRELSYSAFMENTHCNKSNGTNQLKLIKAAFHLDHMCPAPSAVHIVPQESLCHSKLAKTLCTSHESVTGQSATCDLTFIRNVAQAVLLFFGLEIFLFKVF